MNGHCLGCRFWGPYDKKPDLLSEGECRRYPPNVPIEDEFVRGAHLMTCPMTCADEWCGEWQPRA